MADPIVRRKSNQEIDEALAELVRAKDHWRAWGHNGYGAVANKIARFSTVGRAQSGTDISVSDDANNGTTFTILKSGKYSFSWSIGLQQTAAAHHFGFSINSNSLTVQLFSLAASEVLAMDGDRADGSGSSAKFGCASVTVDLQAGDVIRPHAEGQVFTQSFISIARVA